MGNSSKRASVLLPSRNGTEVRYISVKRTLFCVLHCRSKQMELPRDDM